MKCVWMTTGLISYKMCAHDYNCEACIFDRVMRNESAAGDAALADGAYPSAAGSLRDEQPRKINGALFYHRNHSWVSVESVDRATIGIDNLLSGLVSGVRALILPHTGKKIRKGETIAYIVHPKYILEIASPISGTITRVNSALQSQPDTLVDDCWDDGWLVTMKPDSLEQDLRPLYFGKRAFEWYGRMEQGLREAIDGFLNHGRGELGMTMQDGGEKISSLSDILSSDQYYHIIDLISESEDTQ